MWCVIDNQLGMNMTTIFVAVGLLLMMLLVAAEWRSRKTQDILDEKENN
jgi:hypothetical protein|tara:strand:- start:695 stop:841 length:147 start_codon:yes stop_codon:yes gene_type:complete